MSSCTKTGVKDTFVKNFEDTCTAYHRGWNTGLVNVNGEVVMGKLYDSNKLPMMYMQNVAAFDNFRNLLYQIYSLIEKLVFTIVRLNRGGGSSISGYALTLEPSKPTLCHNEKFHNLWIRDCSFRFQY